MVWFTCGEPDGRSSRVSVMIAASGSYSSGRRGARTFFAVHIKGGVSGWWQDAQSTEVTRIQPRDTVDAEASRNTGLIAEVTMSGVMADSRACSDVVVVGSDMSPGLWAMEVGQDVRVASMPGRPSAREVEETPLVADWSHSAQMSGTSADGQSGAGLTSLVAVVGSHGTEVSRAVDVTEDVQEAGTCDRPPYMGSERSLLLKVRAIVVGA